MGCNSTVCRCSSTLQCLALLLPALWLWCLHFDSPRTRGICSTVVTSWGGFSTFIQLGKSLWGASTSLCSSGHTMRAVGSSGWSLTVTGWWVGPLRGFPVGAASSVATSIGADSSAGSSSVEVLIEAGVAFLGIVTLVRSSRDLSCDAALSRTASSENDMYGSTTLLSSRTHPTKRCGWHGISGLAFSAQYCRACTWAMVFCDCPSLISWQVGMPSARYI